MINKLIKMAGKWLATYGKVQQSRDVDELFTSFQVLDESNYYYTGSDVQPTGILALDPKYPLRSKFWKPVEATPAMLEKWVKWMKSDVIAPSPPCGWRIFDRNGALIGLVYAHEKVVVKLENNGQVCVYPPDDPMDQNP